nr:stalk domain-containing protein [Anaerotignum sp. MSJ-24]
MEYSTDPTFATVTDCGNGETTGLTAGTYYVRVKADPEGNYGAGAAAVVVVNEGVERVTVTFDSNGGSKVDSRRIEKGTAVIQPKNPKRSGYSFKGWYSDEELRTKYDFSQPVNEDITLYARWSRSGRGSSSLSSSATNYRVIIEDTDNGIVESDKETASKNSIVTITVKPDKYYEIRGVKVVDNNGNEIKLKDKGDGTYTFTMPASKVYVNASFKEIEKGNVIKMTIGDIEMSANDRVFYNDVAPVIVDNRTMVPIRVITELLGGTADWNEATKEVTLTIDGKEIKMTVGVVLEKYGVAPVIINDRTYVPIRFVADELGAETSWDEATKTVTIYTANK